MPIKFNEDERLERLESYNVMDSLPEQEYDDLVKIAAQICGTPIALVSLLDADRQWFKSRIGLDAAETPRSIAFCNHAIQQSEDIFIVPDATQDERFKNNPLVTDSPDIRFYAGAPIVTKDGYGLGTLCVIDTQPRQLSSAAQESLRALSRQVMRLLELRRDQSQLRAHSEELAKQIGVVRTVYDTVNQSLFTFQVDGIIESANLAAQKCFGYNSDQLLGMPIQKLICQSDSTESVDLMDLIKAQADTEDISDENWLGIRADSSTFPLRMDITPFQTERQGYLAVVRDLSQPRQADEARELHQRRMHQLYKITSRLDGTLEKKLDDLLVEGTTMLGHQLGIISHIKDGDYYIKHFYPESSGLQTDQKFAFTSTYCEITYKHDGVLAIDDMSRSEYSSHPCYAAFQLESYIGLPIFVKGQRYGTLNFSSREPRLYRYPGLDEDYVQAMGHWIGAAIERNMAETEANRLLSILEAAPQLIGMADINTGMPMYLNPGGRCLLGLDPDQPLESTFQDYHTVESAQDIRMQAIPKVIQEGQWVGESYLRHSDGSEIPVLQVLICHKDASGKPLYISTIIQDISKLKEVDRIKSEFIATVSHELRTPLTSIRGSLGLLAGGALGELDPKVKSLINLAANNTDRLVRLINDILDMEKIESGIIEYHFEKLDLAELLSRAVNENQEYAKKHTTGFDLKIQAANCLTSADPDRLRQVLDNLLSNAAKFTRPNTQVQVSLEDIDGRLQVAVQDQGVGIPPEFQDRLFQRFSQSDSSTVRQKGGTGLGLAISKSIIEAHHSELCFESVTDQGCRFYFDLEPLIMENSPSMRSEAKVHAKVLVCEDNADISHLIQLMLENSGMIVDTALSADEALQKVKQNSYDAMTLDLSLPDKDGLDLLKQIRIEALNQSLPVIIVSARIKSAQDDLDASSLCVHDWISKPIDQSRLLHSIANAIHPQSNLRPKILHIEDDEDFAKVIALTLDPVAEVQNVPDKKQALEVLARQRFDLILLDLGLRDGQSADLIPIIQKIEPTPKLVILTGQDKGKELARQVDAMLEKSRTSGINLVSQIKKVYKKNPFKPSRVPLIDVTSR